MGKVLLGLSPRGRLRTLGTHSSIILKAIRSLASDIMRHLTADLEDTESLRNYLKGLPDTGKLNHTGFIQNHQDDFAFIYKYSHSNDQARLCYDVQMERGRVRAITIFDCVVGNFNHSTYHQEFENAFQKYCQASESERVYRYL